MAYDPTNSFSDFFIQHNKQGLSYAEIERKFLQMGPQQNKGTRPPARKKMKSSTRRARGAVASAKPSEFKDLSSALKHYVSQGNSMEKSIELAHGHQNLVKNWLAKALEQSVEKSDTPLKS